MPKSSQLPSSSGPFNPSKLVDPSPKPSKVPLWDGPESSTKDGGITQSMLGRWLVCRERFRVQYILGISPPTKWNHRLGYGDMWHICEEAHAKCGNEAAWRHPAAVGYLGLKNHTKEQCRKYPLQQAEILKWYNVCKVEFPEYVKYWSQHHDVLKRTPLLQEKVFRVPYKLPSGRIVFLRGKWDSVDFLPKHKNQQGQEVPAGLWLMENKTKGEIDELELLQQLQDGFDLQTQFYLTALQDYRFTEGPLLGKHPAPIVGVRYNVVRRPLSGGKGTIIQSKGTKGSKCPKCKGTGEEKVRVQGMLEHCKKCGGVGRIGAKPPETDEEYYGRLAQYIKDEPHNYFMRWNITISQEDIARFRRECLDPALENLYDDYEWFAWCSKTVYKNPDVVFDGENRRRLFPYHCSRHLRFPSGVYNPITEGETGPLDSFLRTGSRIGLSQTTLFPELQ